MLKNGLLTLCNFTLPEDIVSIVMQWSNHSVSKKMVSSARNYWVDTCFQSPWNVVCFNQHSKRYSNSLWWIFQVFIYKDIVVILLLVIRNSDLHQRQDSFLQRISLYMLNNVVRSVDNVEKLLVGDQGAVKVRSLPHSLWLILASFKPALHKVPIHVNENIEIIFSFFDIESSFHFRNIPKSKVYISEAAAVSLGSAVQNSLLAVIHSL